MAKHLYFIGNGFDLHHEINSSYGHFRDWMSENNPDVMNSVEEIYGDCDNDWWSDFENQLASLDAIRFGEEIAWENPPDLMSEHCDRTWNDAEIEVEQQLESLYSDLRACFHDWIEQLDMPLVEKMVRIEMQDSIFINFNYTKTLENLYGVNSNRVLHIHGCVDCDEDFILGHGKSYEELQQINKEDYPEPSDNLTSEEIAQFYEKNTENGHEIHEQFAIGAAINGVASQRKPVAELIKKYTPFFESINAVKYIHVYGLSISDVDMPYLEYFASKYKDSHWEFSDYEDQNRTNIENFCHSNNIQIYSIIDLDNLQIVRQLSIDFSE